MSIHRVGQPARGPVHVKAGTCQPLARRPGAGVHMVEGLFVFELVFACWGVWIYADQNI